MIKKYPLILLGLLIANQANSMSAVKNYVKFWYKPALFGSFTAWHTKTQAKPALCDFDTISQTKTASIAIPLPSYQPLEATFKLHADIYTPALLSLSPKQPYFRDFNTTLDTDFLINCFNQNSHWLGGRIIDKHNVTYYTDTEKFIITILHIEEKQIGFAIYNIDTGYISYLAIDKQYHKAGYGATFMQYVINQLKRNGCKRVTLCVVPDNAKAIKLYKNIGFKETTYCNFELELAPKKQSGNV